MAPLDPSYGSELTTFIYIVAGMAFAICMLCGIIILIFLGGRIKENKRRQYELENLKETVAEPKYGVYHNPLRAPSSNGNTGKLSALSSPSERGVSELMDTQSNSYPVGYNHFGHLHGRNSLGGCGMMPLHRLSQPEPSPQPSWMTGSLRGSLSNQSHLSNFTNYSNYRPAGPTSAAPSIMMQASIPEMDETNHFDEDADEMESIDPRFKEYGDHDIHYEKDEELYRIYPVHSNDTAMHRGEIDGDEEDEEEELEEMDMGLDVDGDRRELEQLKESKKVETGDVGWEEYT